jgi:hypothetical protein
MAKQSQLKKIFKGWAAFFVITNITFYSVKWDIDRRRKDEYLKALELERDS